MLIALITPYKSSDVKGGIETFNDYLKKVFPELVIIDYQTSKNHSFLSKLKPLPIISMEDPKRALICGKYFLKLHSKSPFDVVFANGMFGWYLNFRKLDIPMVNLHHGSYASFADNALQKNSIDYFVTKHLYGPFEKLSGRNKENIAVSGFIKEQIKRYYGLDSTVIHNCVDVKRFKPIAKDDAREELKLPPDTPIGIFVGRPSYSKGFDVFLKTAELNKNVDFLCVTEAEIKPPNKNVIVRSKVPNEDMYMYYSASDFLIFPSRFEGCSYVPLEAMACNLPVIASKTGLFYEMEDPSSIGYVIPSFDPAEYSRVVRLVVSENVKFRPRKFVVEHFTFDVFKRNYRDLVNKLVGK
jgi:glycosyltransferase involved in cell wall biosynthesis